MHQHDDFSAGKLTAASGHWRRVVWRWQSLSITSKYSAAFGLLLVLILLVTVTSYVSLTVVQRETEAAILASSEIQRLVLDMDRKLEKARRLQRDFFLRYPQLGLADARQSYALPAVQELSQVISLSSELKQRIAQSEVSAGLRVHDVDLNLYLSAAERFTETFLDAVDLVSRLAAPDTGLEAQLRQNGAQLGEIIRSGQRPSLIALFQSMRTAEKDYFITRQRPFMQSALNSAFLLEQALADTKSLGSDSREQALVYLENYRAAASEIPDLDQAIQGKYADFDLQAESVDPISIELISLAEQEVDRARMQIERTKRLATIILTVIALTGLALTLLIAKILNESVTRNVVRLTDTARQLEAGNLDVRAQIDSFDELGQLADTFNAMAAEINAKVAEMTVLNQALQVSERKYRKLFENSLDAITVTTPEGRFLDINEAGIRLFGYTRRDLLTRNVETLYANPKDHQQFRQTLERDGAIGNFEVELRRSDGTVMAVVLNSTVHRAEDGTISAFQSVIHDVTKRKQAEEEIRRRNRELTLLNRVIAASTSGTEAPNILETTCRELVLAFHLPLVLACLISEQKRGVVVAAEYLSPGQSSALKQFLSLTDGPVSQQLLDNKSPVLIDNTQSAPHSDSLHSLVKGWGLDLLLLVPITPREEVAACLGLGAVRPRTFSNEEIDLAWSVANQVAGALDRIGLDEERRRLQEQYYQAQKMEAIGLLAGGIAHDFNNLLTAINGFAELLQYSLASDDSLRELVDKILGSGQRAADLVRQLLAFSRRQVIEPQIILLNDIVVEMEKILRRIIGENIEMEVDLPPGLWPIKADPVQVEQIIINLAVNARDAMPEGGRLTIETTNLVLVEKNLVDYPEIGPGEYVLLKISDSGCGISVDVKDHIFEPFFTTKEQGKGTGLGLATVYGIVQQSKGSIWVHSAEEEGTTFTVCLPRAVEEATPLKSSPEVRLELFTGSETILLVEDQGEVRHMVRHMLQGQGYTVLAAGDGQEALELADTYSGPIDLLLTDVIMPGISGRDLAGQLARNRPALKTVFMSGYADNILVEKDLPELDTVFLQKPFNGLTLARKIRSVLDK